MKALLALLILASAASAAPLKSFLQVFLTRALDRSGSSLYTSRMRSLVLLTCLLSVRQASAQAPAPPSVDFSYDVSPDLRKRVIEDLTVMRDLEVSDATPLHRQVFGSGSGGLYLRFFQERIKSISMGDCEGSKGAIACVIHSKDPSKLWLTERYISDKEDPVFRVAILLHESRHVDGWHHVACPDTQDDGEGRGLLSLYGSREFAGNMACDDKPLSPYGIETIFLRNIEKSCVSCSGAVRSAAGMHARDAYMRVVDPAARTPLFLDLFQ